MTEGHVWSAERYEKNARFVSDLGMPVVELLAPKSGEHILDLGCGDGALTQKLAEMGCEVVGVDGSPEFVATATQRGLDARVADGQALPFENEFDAVFSNAALHWMRRSEDVIRGVRRALKPGGRFVGECGGQGNVTEITSALHAELIRHGVDPVPLNPWIFLSDTEYRAMLERNGFAVKQIGLIPRPTPLPLDMIGWLETFAGDFAGALPPGDRKSFFEDVQKRLKPEMYRADQQRWVANYVRLRFMAVRGN